MGVVRTDKWLHLYTKYWQEQKDYVECYKWQQQTFVQPLVPLLKTKDVQGLHRYLLEMGLFQPDFNMEQTLALFREKNWWSKIQQYYTGLRQMWKGPDVPIYLLPIDTRNEMLKRQMGNKNGLTLSNVILLFIDGFLETDDVRALLTHEYHHVCRLVNTGATEKTITLLESMLMEGLAEMAVQEEVGDHALAIWTSYYNQAWKNIWFYQWIEPHMYVKGRENHHAYLYGSVQQGIPKWLGYYWGFQTVKSAVQKSKTKQTKDWFSMEAEEIVKESDFIKINGGV